MFLILFLLFSAIVYLVNQSKKIDEGFIASDEQKEPYYDFPCCVTKDYVRPDDVPNGDTSGGPSDTPDVPDADSGGSNNDCLGFIGLDDLPNDKPFIMSFRYTDHYCVLNRKQVKQITNFEGFRLPHNLDYYNNELSTLLRKNVVLYEFDSRNNSFLQNEYDFTSETVFELGFQQNSNYGLHLTLPAYIDRSNSSIPNGLFYFYFYRMDYVRKGRYVIAMGFNAPNGVLPNGTIFEPITNYSPGNGYILGLIGFTNEQEAIKFVEIMSNFTKEASEYETAASSDEGYSGHTEDPEGYATMGTMGM